MRRAKHLARLKKLDMTWGLDLNAIFRESTQKAPAAGDTGDGTVGKIGSSEGGAVDASSAQAG